VRIYQRLERMSAAITSAATHCVVVCCSRGTLSQCTTSHYTATQCVAVCCSRGILPPHTATYCVAVCCSRSHRSILQSTVLQCVLQWLYTVTLTEHMYTCGHTALD